MAFLTSIGPFRFLRQKRENQTNVYWDTPQGRLRKSGAVLKSRTVGSRRTLTFKREVAYRDGVSRRVEISRPIRGRTLRDGLPAALRLEPVRRARRVAGSRPWVKVLTLKTDRCGRIFSHRRSKIEMDLDRVSVLKGNRRLANYREVELENLNAPAPVFRKALTDLRRRFRGRLRSSRLSKYEIGLRLSKEDLT